MTGTASASFNGTRTGSQESGSSTPAWVIVSSAVGGTVCLIAVGGAFMFGRCKKGLKGGRGGSKGVPYPEVRYPDHSPDPTAPPQSIAGSTSFWQRRKLALGAPGSVANTADDASMGMTIDTHTGSVIPFQRKRDRISAARRVAETFPATLREETPKHITQHLDAYIENQGFLYDYFCAFNETLQAAYLSALTVQSGNVQGSTTVGQAASLMSGCLFFVPGAAVVGGGAKAVAEVMLKNNCKQLLGLIPSQFNYNERLTALARIMTIALADELADTPASPDSALVCKFQQLKEWFIVNKIDNTHKALGTDHAGTFIKAAMQKEVSRPVFESVEVIGEILSRDGTGKAQTDIDSIIEKTKRDIALITGVGLHSLTSENLSLKRITAATPGAANAHVIHVSVGAGGGGLYGVSP